MSLNFSYAVSLQTEKTIGLTPSNRSETVSDSLRQAMANVLPEGKQFKLDILIPITQSKTIDLSALGMTYIRAILLKSNVQFGYSLGGNVWHLTRTVLIDMYDDVPQGNLTTANTYTKPLEIKLENPSVTPSALIEVMVIGQ